MIGRGAGWTALATLGLLAALVAGCGQGPTQQLATGTGDEAVVPSPEETLTCIAEYAQYAEAAHLVAKSDVIVRGTVTASRPDRTYPDVSDVDPETLPEGTTLEQFREAQGINVTVLSVTVTDAVKGDVRESEVLEVLQNVCGETPLEVGGGTDYVLALSTYRPGFPLNQVNADQASYLVTGEGSLRPVSADNDLGVDSLDDLTAHVGSVAEREPDDQIACIRAAVTATPAEVRPGGTVTLTRGPSECDAGLPEGSDHTLTLGLGGRAAPVPLGTVPVEEDGSFTATVGVPAGLPPGDAVVVVDGSSFRCEPGPGCTGQRVDLTLVDQPRLTGSAAPADTRSSASCAVVYSPAALEETTFAVDGTVTAVGPGGPLSYSRVTFLVHEWFSGGSGPQLTADMTPPLGAGGVMSSSAQAEMPDYGVGSRLLVAGAARWGGAPTQDAVVWGCGFTRPHDGATAAVWAEALG